MLKISGLSRVLNKYVNIYRIMAAYQFGSLTLIKRLFISNNLDKRKLDLHWQLYTKILACGPITLAEYMKEILTHPTAGYYTTKDIFGQRSDFITSPEISQLFGEIIATWIINEWKKISKNSFQLVELGPGRGTLISDILRVFKKLMLSSKISVHLVEISPVLSTIQAKKLCIKSKDCEPKVNKNQKNSITHYREGITKDGIKIYWYYSISDVPREFSIFVAHEFFDALPIHKFQKTDKGWREVLVDIVQESKEKRFRYILSPMPTAACKVYISPQEKRDHMEISPQCCIITDYMSQFLWENGGFALVIDYGHEGKKTDTFRAFYQHKLHNPLLNPGIADLTADVDFLLMKKIAEKDDRLITFGPVTQRKFLKSLGIDLRLKMLQNATDTQIKQIESGYHMITDEDKMGNCFKILSFFPSVLKDHLDKWPVAGFENKNEAKS